MAEPVRKSVYNVLKQNLKLAKRRTFINRYVYLGEHKNEAIIESIFSKIVNQINDDYTEERITGLLLIYPNYFIHVVDTCETTFQNHLLMLFPHHDDFIGEATFMGCCHHINQRYFDEWGIRKANPPNILEKIQTANFEDIKCHLKICVLKIHNLCVELRQKENVIEEHSPQTPPTVKIGEIVPYKMKQYIPKYNEIKFILEEPIYIKLRQVLTFEAEFFDNKHNMHETWPVRSDYVPYTVFEEQVNPVQDIPNSKKNK